jgi:large subunit ribosomal protein L9
MEVILLEPVRKLGSVGEIVNVKNGYGRYLVRYGKVMRATEEAKEAFTQQKEIIEQENSKKLAEAQKLAASLDKMMITMIRQAAEDGRLFGSVTAKDIAAAIAEDKGIKVSRSSVVLSTPIKNSGVHQIVLSLHANVNVTVSINVARSEDEAAASAKQAND